MKKHKVFATKSGKNTKKKGDFPQIGIKNISNENSI